MARPDVNRKRRLSSALIMETALSLAEQEGMSGLTVRRLGQELGADPTALYRHFRGKDELLMMLVDYLIGQVVSAMGAESIESEQCWQDVVSDGARRTVATFSRYPGLAAAIGKVLIRRDSEPSNVEPMLRLLTTTGLSDEDVVLHYRTWVDFLLAYASLNAQNALVTPEQRRFDADEWQRRRDTLEPGEAPTVARLGGRLYEVEDHQVLEAWLRMFIASVEHHVAQYAR